MPTKPKIFPSVPYRKHFLTPGQATTFHLLVGTAMLTSKLVRSGRIAQVSLVRTLVLLRVIFFRVESQERGTEQRQAQFRSTARDIKKSGGLDCSYQVVQKQKEFETLILSNYYLFALLTECPQIEFKLCLARNL